MKTEAELQQLKRYLYDALGIDVTAIPWAGVDRLPHFLKELYTFAQVNLLGTSCLLMIDVNPPEASPATIRKHLDLVRSKHAVEVIYVRQQVTAYNRKRLIEQKIPFIVPGNQMYLPLLGIDLREHFRRLRSEIPAFSPATQTVVIHMLLHDNREELTPLDMAQRLGYSAMTMSRAFDELEAADLGRATIRGRERCFRLAATRQETWVKAQPLLRSPVNKRLFIRRGVPPTDIRAGLTALAHYSMLSPPAHPILAVSWKQWRQFRQDHKAVCVPAADPDGEEIQVWSYSPVLFARGDFVDPLSLYLSLKDDRDERVQGALEEMMRKIEW